MYEKRNSIFKVEGRGINCNKFMNIFFSLKCHKKYIDKNVYNINGYIG